VGIDPAKKLTIIKEAKTLLGLGLKEAKELIEKLPALVKQSAPTEEAEKLQADLEKLGCQVKLS